MKKAILFLLLMAGFSAANAQNSTKIKTDTIAQGYFLPLDTNVVSCKIRITRSKGISFEQNCTGNKLSPALIDSIGKLPIGGIVTYEEITVNGKNGLEKSPAVRYVIGSRNSRFALRAPTDLERVTAAALSQMVFDNNYVSFVVSFREGEKFVEVKASGNKMPASATEKIKSLPPGSKVFIEQVQAKNENGTIFKSPGRTFIIVN